MFEGALATMGGILDVTMPIYLLIALGYASARLGWIAPEAIRLLGQFVIRFCVPALLFRALAHQPLDAVLNFGYLGAYAGGSLLSMGAVLWLARMRGRPMALATLQGMGAAGSNSSYFGYPIVLQVIGPTAGLALALCAIVENLLIIPLGLALAETGGPHRPWRQVLGGIAASLLRTPLILAMLLGLVASGVGLPLPVALDRSVGLLGAAAAPTALFVVGGSLVGLRFEGLRTDIALVTTCKLVLHPLCVLALLLALQVQPPVLRAAAVLFAAVPMMSIYPLLALRYGHERFCAATLLATTLVSFFTITITIACLPAHWIPVH